MPVSRTIEITGRHKDGSELPLEFSLTSWGSKDGFFFTGICRDISERKQAQQRQAQLTAQIEAERRQAQNLADTLARERDILQAIMESTSTMLAYLDRDFNFVLANSAYVNASGHSREELIGHNHFDLFPNAENQAIFERVRDTGQPVEYHAKPFTYADQPERGVTYWDWTLAPVRTASGQIEGVVLALLDVTQDVRRAEERERLLREMATQQAVAAERERLSRELHDGIAQSLGYVRFRLRSVKDLLVAGRMAEASAGLAELEDVVRGINANLRESILGLRATAAVRDVGMLASLADYLRHFDQLFDIRTNLIVEPDAVTQFAPATEVQIFAIIQEAMINIRKHAQTGRATVRFSRVGDEAIVAIADQGRGFDVGCIPAGHYGLSIMRERADLINGKLQVVSEPGQGTTIILRLPVT
jgi:PAS domain S-box-containing protein